MKFSIHTALFFTLLAFVAPLQIVFAEEHASESSMESVDVFASGSGGYHTYRIPAIVATKSGALLAFCEARKESKSDTGNIDLLLKRSADDGKTWSESIVIWDDDKNTCGNATPVVDQSTGTIWLPMTWNLGSDHEGEIKAGTSKHPRRVFLTHSNDDGLTWAEPTEITDVVRKDHWRWYATGPGNAIQLTRGEHKGRLLIPANTRIIPIQKCIRIAAMCFGQTITGRPGSLVEFMRRKQTNLR